MEELIKFQGIQCNCYLSNPQNLYVILDKRVKGRNKIICKKCSKIENQIKVEHLDLVIEEINQRKTQQKNCLQEMVKEQLQYIDQFQSSICQLKTYVIQKFDSILNFCKEQIDFLIKLIEEKLEINFNQELDEIEDNSKSLNNFLRDKLMKISETERGIVDKIEKSYLSIQDQLKTDFIVKEYKNKTIQGIQDSRFQNISRMLPSKIQENISSNNNQVNQQKINYKLIQEIRQTEFCYAMAFNQDDTLLAAGFTNQIKIWKFNKGQLIENKSKLKGESEIDIPTCLTFSKKSNMLYCGSYNGSMSIWKEINENYWERLFNQIVHQGLITCLIVNKQEDEIITSGSDKLIIVWKINEQQNNISYYMLNKHKKSVFSISLNQSETQLVSSSLDQKLLIWEKNYQQKYEFKYEIQKSTNDFGHRILFLNDNLIIWQQNQDGTTHLFQKENERFKHKPEMQIGLNHSEREDGQLLFPIIYNKEKQTLIQKFQNSIFIFQYHQNQQFKLETRIDCSTNSIYGSMTKDGKYLIYWDCKLQVFNIYEFNYQ